MGVRVAILPVIALHRVGLRAGRVTLASLRERLLKQAYSTPCRGPGCMISPNLRCLIGMVVAFRRRVGRSRNSSQRDVTRADRANLWRQEDGADVSGRVKPGLHATHCVGSELQANGAIAHVDRSDISAHF